MNKIKSYLKKLKAFDLVVVVFFVMLILLNIIFHNRVEYWDSLILLNLCIIFFVFFIAFLEERFSNNFFRALHFWYIAPIILITFKELYLMIKPIRVYDFDYLFIQIDRWMFGTDPTVWLYQIANPVLTEILQIVYTLFYLLPILLGLFLLKNKRYEAMDFSVFMIIYGFYLSYLGYFALPGIGPRFTLHDFSMLNAELPGLWLTHFLRESVNIGESIPAGTLDPASVVQRDVFPSGHTMITLIVMYLSVKLQSRSKYFFLPVGSLLIFATVYLRYHYVVDLIGGALFMAFSVWSGKIIYNWWRRKIGLEEFVYDRTKF
ncbi:MAG: phosphatase PAP2 family protein [Ignavibacteriaceae bacterium]|nr:phosphatase PAP2 family protein [Ignavibacteriaceae bacterium]